MTVSTIRRQPARGFARVGALALVLVALLVALRASDGAFATSGAGPYTVPSVVDTNPDPDIVETTITSDEATVDVGVGVSAHVDAFNGTIPGPTFRLKVGDTVIVHYVNNLAHGSGIHWHGIELANASDGTPLTQNLVPPGGTFEYRFVVPRPGIYWYHPHHHSSTNQVFKGLYGMIVVEDPHEAALQSSGALPPASQTLPLALSDITVCRAPGSNTGYDLTLPYAGGGALPAQQGPGPADLCEGGSPLIPAPLDEEGNPLPAGTVLAAGDVPNIQLSGTGGRVNEGITVLTNGMNVGGRAGSPSAPGALAAGAHTFDVQAGQGIRLQIGNFATVRFFRLLLTDAAGTQIPLVRVGGEGGLLDDAVVEGGVVGGFDFKYGSGEIMLDPGSRADVVAAIPPSATGVLTLWTQDFERTGQGFAKIPTVPVMHLNVTGTAASTYTIGAGTPLRSSIPGAAVEQIGPPTGTLIDPATLSPARPGLASQDIRLTATGNSLGIDDVLGAHDFPGDFTTIPHADSARYAYLGDTLELTVTNATLGAHHPFHLHGFSIQPIELTRPGGPNYTFPYAEFRDNIDIPPGYSLRLRIKLEDRPMMDGTSPGGGVGRWVFHCHIFFHAVFGMISEFVVLPDPSPNEAPTIAADAASVTVDEGGTATMTGTYDDPDGDPLTFGASVGTVTDNGDGTWSWSYPTTDGPDESQTVDVSATDGEETAEASFELVVENVAPAVTVDSPTDGQLFQLADVVPVDASFADPGSADTHTCTIAWGDGETTPGTVAAGACTGSHNYAVGGPKTITVTVTDDDGGVGSDSVTIDINTPPDCTPVQPDLNVLWPANHALVTITIDGATDADGDVVTLTVTGVTQDEALDSTGDGSTEPDAALVAGHSDQALLRAERAGAGDGRVYRLSFGGDDGRGGTCTGTVEVAVPKSRNGTAAVHSGIEVDSL